MFRKGYISEFLKVGILGSRIPDIIKLKSGHFPKINNNSVNLPELYNNLPQYNLFLVLKALFRHITAYNIES